MLHSSDAQMNTNKQMEHHSLSETAQLGQRSADSNKKMKSACCLSMLQLRKKDLWESKRRRRKASRCQQIFVLCVIQCCVRRA